MFQTPEAGLRIKWLKNKQLVDINKEISGYNISLNPLGLY